MVHETDRVRTNKSELLFAMLRDWDPIGISDIPEAKDEYDAYADLVLGMLINENATAEEIANYLFNIATEHMALSDREMGEAVREDCSSNRGAPIKLLVYGRARSQTMWDRNIGCGAASLWSMRFGLCEV
jgi:hypothetical protein